MPLVEQLCDSVAVMPRGAVVAAGTVEQVRGTGSLEEMVVEVLKHGRLR